MLADEEVDSRQCRGSLLDPRSRGLSDRSRHTAETLQRHRSHPTPVRGSLSEDDAATQGVDSECPIGAVCFPTILRFGTGFCI